MKRTMRCLIATLGIALAMTVGLTPAQAMTVEVSYPGDDTYGSLQDAIDAAGDGDTVTLTDNVVDVSVDGFRDNGEGTYSPGPKVYTVRFFSGDAFADPYAQLGEAQVEDGECASFDDPTCDGYVFTGWIEAVYGAPFSLDTPIEQDMSLIAQWKKMPDVTVTFDTDGGSAVDSETVNYNTQIAEPKVPTKDGYTFAGWVDADGKAFDFTTPITEDMTLKATWTKNAEIKPSTTPTGTTAPVATTTTTTTAVPNTGDATATGMGAIALVGIVTAGAAMVVRRRTQN